MNKYLVVLIFQLMLTMVTHATIIYDGVKGHTTVRALSMGNAFTAVAESEGAMMYNPAGFTIKGGRYSFQLLDYKEQHYNTYFMHSFYNQPMGYSYWKLEKTNGDHLSVNSVGYGQKGSRSIDWGINYKWIKGKELSADISGWSADLGIMIHFLPFMDVGIVGHDIVNNDVPISSSWVTGLSFFPPKKNIILTTDFYKNEADDLKARYGIEYVVAQGLTVRGGWYEDNFTAGTGVILPFGEIEYGVVIPENDTKSTHVLGFKLGKGTGVDQFRKKYSVFKPKSYAVMELGKGTVGGGPEISMLGGQKLGSNDLIQLIRHAREDRTCKGFIVRLTPFQSGLSELGLVQEIRQELQKAKQLNKEVIVYIDHWATLSEYYLASVADTVYMPELGTISHLGVEIEVQKTGQLLANFGIRSTSIASGAFKDRLGSETSPLSEYEKRDVEVLVNHLYHYVISEIQKDRRLNDAVIDNLFTGEFITASRAKDAGLIDAFSYWQELPDLIEKKTGKEVHGESLISYRPPRTTITMLSLLNRIAVIEIDGPIQLGHNTSDLFYGGKATGAKDIDAVVKSINDDVTIRGVIVRVNSPGGSMLASDQIYHAFGRLRDNGKKVYISMGNIAASGGYYVSLNSDKIFASPMTLTGSVGVLSSYRDYEALNEVVGITHDVINTGKYMSVGSSRKQLSSDEKLMVSSHQDQLYQHFVDKLIRHRALSEKEAYDVAQGQVFLGETAHKLNLVDQVGGFYDVVDDLSEDLKISHPKLVTYRPAPKWEISRKGLGQILSPFKLFFKRLKGTVPKINTDF